MCRNTCLASPAPGAGLPASPLRGRITRPDVRVSFRTSPRPAPLRAPAPTAPAAARRAAAWRRCRPAGSTGPAPSPSHFRTRSCPAGATSCTMSVAGLKKQFHKATQVRRVTGASRSGPWLSREGRLGAWGPQPIAESALAAPRISRLSRGGCGTVDAGSRPPHPLTPPRCGAAGARGSLASRLVFLLAAPAPPLAGAAGRGPQLHRSGAQVPRRHGGDYVKSLLPQ